MINEADISIVVQGAVLSVTKAVLEGLRTVLPKAELILSTWKGTDLSGLDFDKAVLSPDPGAQIADEVAHTANNVNRQIVSTSAGLQAASRPFILKTRTDILINSAGFLRYFGKYDGYAPCVFKNRLLICDYYTRNPRAMPLCFHPSDWLLFGNAEDIRTYYQDISMQTEEESAWFRRHKKTQTLFTNYLSRFTPEQYIFISFLRRFQAVDINCYYESGRELICLTERLFAECFVVLDYQKQLDIHFLKYDPNRYLEKHTLLSHQQWRTLYRHYCEKSVSPQWWVYRALNGFTRFRFLVRKTVIGFLDAIGLKEAVKSVLRGNSTEQL